VIVESNHLTYIGIDVQAAQKPFYYTALDGELETIACGHGRLTDVLAYLAGQSSALVAVNGPIQLHQTSPVFSQAGLFGSEHSTGAGPHRGLDFDLPDRESPPIQSLSFGKKPALWMERSMELAKEMKHLGYTEADVSTNNRAYFETNTDAACHRITGVSPYDSRSLEGRLQRQLLLYEFGFPLQDPMAFLEEFTRFRLRTSNVPLTQIETAHELRALIAGATAWLMDYRPETLEYLKQGMINPMVIPKEFTRK
jgi:hypothetical protein